MATTRHASAIAAESESPESPSMLEIIETLAVNFIPLIGILFWQWSLFPVVFLYWVENIIVGVTNWMRIVSAHGPEIFTDANGNPQERPANPFASLFLGGFFLVHYGIFTAVHGVFVFTLFGSATLDGTGGIFSGGNVLGTGSDSAWDHNLATISEWPMAVAIGGLAASHMLLFFRDAANGVLARTRPDDHFMAPYGRIVVLHILILGGAFIIMSLGGGTFMVVLLVLLKTALELAVGSFGWVKFDKAQLQQN